MEGERGEGERWGVGEREGKEKEGEVINKVDIGKERNMEGWRERGIEIGRE